MTAPTLPEFILARVADWEAAARDVSEVARNTVPEVANGLFELSDEDWAGGLRIDPARVLAQCAAYRSIVAHATDCDESPIGGWCHSCDVALRDLATIWADHPDFDERWRP